VFFGFGLHAGVPLAVAESKHVTIEIIPYLQYLYGGSNITTGSGMTQTDYSNSHNIFQLGGRLAAEVQFGFLGMPQLSVTAQFGLALAWQGTSFDTNHPYAMGRTSESASSLSIGTNIGAFSVQDILSTGISATYYFGGGGH
jgi:hypothetical protein